MNFTLSEEQSAIQAMAANFAKQEMEPYAADWDKDHHFPEDTLRKAAELGMAAITIGTDVGGSGLSRVDAAIIFEELSTACPSTAAYISVHNMASWLIDHYGND